MLNNSMERNRRILELLESEPSVATARLAGWLGVSAMTVWRDLVALEERGLIKRLHGRISRADRTQAEPDFQSKIDRFHAAKAAIAAYAARHLIGTGDTLAMDGGTTVAAIGTQTLPSRLTVFTNSLNTARLLIRHTSRPSVYCCGGLLREQSETFIGREALSFFCRRKVDRCFLSATGVDAEAGITDLTLEDNEVKQVMAASAKEVILLADRSKFGEVSLMEVLPWRRVRHLVTNATENQLAPIRKIAPGLHVHVTKA
jgi:DeoR family fructose operon transcriptional repressor